MPTILRCTSEHFDVVYVINAHMKPGLVNRERAQEQWRQLGELYRSIGVDMEEVLAVEGFPDMVFCANQSFPYWGPNGEKRVLLSKMAAEQRRGEVAYLADWYRAHGYSVDELPADSGSFEGMGDAIVSRDRSVIFGGYGFRTDPRVYDELERFTGLPVLRLNLEHPEFYHLDVCLAVMDEKTALVYSPAFAAADRAQLDDYFSDLIELTELEAMTFAGNAHSPDGHHVVLQQGSPRVEEELRRRGFEVHAVDTSEFIHAGGSVFCLKMDLL